MTYATMPESLLLQLESLAKSRDIAKPTDIIRWDLVERRSREPKRPKKLYWQRDE